jgi:hypothetical protein
MIFPATRLLRSLLLGAALGAGLLPVSALARTLYATQMRLSGKPVTQLGFLLEDEAGPMLVQVKPKGFAGDEAPRVRRLGPNPGPVEFTVGELVNAASRVSGGSLQYYSVTVSGTGPKGFTLTADPGSQAVLLRWDQARQAPVVAEVLRAGEDLVYTTTSYEPIHVVGAPLCTPDGRAFGVIVGPGERPTEWRYQLLAPRAALAGQVEKSHVPLSRATTPLRITPLAPDNSKLLLSSPPERPCVEIHGVAGQVIFRARNRAGDKTFSMLDPEFQKAVRERGLDRLVPGNLFAYTELGTLRVPVKVMNFPLLGQDMTGTCWVAHYREWLFYYLGTRHRHVPALEDLRGYLNLFTEPVTVERLFDPSRRKAANKFEGSDSYASKHSVAMRENIDRFFREFFVGAETEPTVEFKDITQDYTRLRPTQKARKLSEAEFGEIMNGLLLGQMTLARSESHVMNILGFEGDEVMISTWAREFKGTLRQLARMDPRGPLLMPLEFNQHTIVARAADGHVVIPALSLAEAEQLGGLDRRAVARFNADP